MRLLLFGRRSLWVAIGYGLLLGIGFLASPVPVATGIGEVGVESGPAFAITVLLAHLLFGIILGWLSRKFTRRSSIVGHVRRMNRNETA